MKKLLDAYVKNPSKDNAEKIYQYARKHPMATASLTYEDLEVFEKAKRQATFMGRPSLSLTGM